MKQRILKKTAAVILVFCIVFSVPIIAKADTVTYTWNTYYLTIVDNSSVLPSSTRQMIVNTFFEVYPQMTSRFNPSASKTVTLTIDPNYSGAAYASGNNIVLSANWINSNPNDTDCITHELMHVVQAYPHYNPVWLIEGIADYARYRYGINNPASGWSLPNYSPSQHYTDSYRVTARFLAWCEMNIDNGIVNKLDERLRNNTYNSNTWAEICGYTVDQLWNLYSQNPTLQRAEVKLFEHADYGGWSVSLGLGYYTLSTLQSYGFVNDQLSSLIVPLGYKVTLYTDDNFSGSSIVFASTSNYIGDEFNDKVSSIKIERAYYYIQSRHSGKYLDVQSGSWDNGAPIIQWSFNGGLNQQWQVTDLGNGYCAILSRQTGKAMDVKDWATHDGGIIHQWAFVMGTNQQWQVQYVDGNYVAFTSRHSGKVADVKDVSSEDGAIIHQWTYVGGYNQQWQLYLAN